MIGQPIDRVDGPLKITGKATYAYEDWSAGQPLYGFIVGATIGHGRIARIDTARAEQAPGVRRVLTYRDATGQREPDHAGFNQYDRAYPVMHRPEIGSYGEPVALVVAATLEQARAAATLVEVSYDVGAGAFELATRLAHAFAPATVNAGMPADTAIGDLDAALAAAPISLDEVYTTPYELSQAMEPHGSIAVWNGDVVTVHVATQIVASARARIAATFGLEPRQITIVSRYVGGGFGSKLGIHADAILAVLAARILKQPVKVTLTRQQMFQLIGNRPTTIQRVRLGAERDGTLTAFGHDVVMKTSTGDDYIEQTATVGRALYAAPNRRTTHRGVALDLPLSEDVRAPGEAPGLLAVESAIDELAYRLKLDPVQLRIKNEPARHPETGVPYSERRLVECLRDGARRFGWDRRPATPASVRDGRALVGYGMAAAIRPHFQWETSVLVRLEPSGIAIVRSDMTDIGTGTYTILTQVAAETLGLPLDRIRVELGHSDFPPSGGSGGSWGAANSTSATHRACRALRDKLVAAVIADKRSPLHGRDPKAAVFSRGRVTIGDASDLIVDILGRSYAAGIEATGSVPSLMNDPNYAAYSISTYGAHFAEVRVDIDTGEVRLRRMLGVFDCGRIFNAKTARSQLIGGMIWGVSSALHEDAVVDPRSGAFVNRDLAQYLVPVHADIPAIEAIVLDGFDNKANELGAKGIGELGTCGSGAAVANAVFNATGIRVREFPITIEKLLAGLPKV